MPDDQRAGEWRVEHLLSGRAFLLTPGGMRVAEMTKARAVGIAAALNTSDGRRAFMEARLHA